MFYWKKHTCQKNKVKEKQMSKISKSIIETMRKDLNEIEPILNKMIGIKNTLKEIKKDLDYLERGVEE